VGFAAFDSSSPKTGTYTCGQGQAVLSAVRSSDNENAPSVALHTRTEVNVRPGSPGAIAARGDERAPGTSAKWAIFPAALCADGTNTPIVTPFDLNGQWDAGSGPDRPATIGVADNGTLSVDLSPFNRPIGRGGINDNTHITASFPDDQTYIGTLVAPNRIFWSNHTTWTKLGDLVGTVRGVTGKCVDVFRASTASGTPIQLLTCSGNPAQNWQVRSDGTLRAFGKCLDITGGATANGTPIQLWDCNGLWAQVWEPQPDGTLRNPVSGRCLDTASHSSADLTRLVLWQCTPTTPSQIWRLPGA
jgi:hypothetical protein